MVNKEKVKSAIAKVRDHGWQVLEMRNCGLEEIPMEVFELENIRLLDLSNDSYCDERDRNKISLIPQEIVRLKDLATLKLPEIHLRLSQTKL
jgi:internalin A